jgi:hypothetical protein
VLTIGSVVLVALAGCGYLALALLSSRTYPAQAVGETAQSCLATPTPLSSFGFDRVEVGPTVEPEAPVVFATAVPGRVDVPGTASPPPPKDQGRPVHEHPVVRIPEDPCAPVRVGTPSVPETKPAKAAVLCPDGRAAC